MKKILVVAGLMVLLALCAYGAALIGLNAPTANIVLINPLGDGGGSPGPGLTATTPTQYSDGGGSLDLG